MVGLLPRRTQAGAAGPKSVGNLTVSAWSGTVAAGPVYRLPGRPTRTSGARVTDTPQHPPNTSSFHGRFIAHQMHVLRDPAPRAKRAAGGTWPDQRPDSPHGQTARPLRQDTPTHEPGWLTLTCALECTLQVRAHSLAPATAGTRPKPSPARAVLFRASHVLPLLFPFWKRPFSFSPLQQAKALPRFTRIAVPYSSLFETLPHPPCVFHPFTHPAYS